MKFRFCGDGDCPDWVLGEILSTLSMLSSVKLRILAGAVAKAIVGPELPEEKIREIFATSKSDINTPKSAISCIRFLLINATRHNADEATFGEELQQLGLPKEHAASLCRVLAESSSDIRKYLTESTLRVNELKDVKYSIPTNVIDCVQLQVEIMNELNKGLPRDTLHTINIHKTDLKVLVNDMKELRLLMETYGYENKYKK